jgi:hypothetical protein
VAYGWSDASHADAESHARQRLAVLEERMRRGEKFPQRDAAYAYGRSPLREEIVDEIHDSDDRIVGVITRNSYGSLVVNAAHALFVDVDWPAPSVLEQLAALFRKGHDRGSQQLAALRQVLQGQPGAGFRVYRTAAGFRVLATTPPFAPESPQTETLLRAAGADPAFVQLCRLQRSFRARLTPKPWRLQLPKPPAAYPRDDDPDAQAMFEKWLTDYTRASETKATCHFVESIGNPFVHSSIAPILRLHDDYTKALSTLPLA